MIWINTTTGRSRFKFQLSVFNIICQTEVQKLLYEKRSELDILLFCLQFFAFFPRKCTQKPYCIYKPTLLYPCNKSIWSIIFSGTNFNFDNFDFCALFSSIDFRFRFGILSFVIKFKRRLDYLRQRVFFDFYLINLIFINEITSHDRLKKSFMTLVCWY